MQLLIKTKTTENGRVMMKQIDTIHVENDQIRISDIRKLVEERSKMESFSMWHSGRKLEKNQEKASFYNIGHFDSIFIVPQIMSIEAKKHRSSTFKKIKPNAVDAKTSSWYEDLHWRKRKRLRPILDLLRIASDKERCRTHASNLHLQSALFLFSSRGFHDFELASKHSKLLGYRLANSTSVDAVDILTGYSNADILKDDFHKLGFTYSSEPPDLTILRQRVMEHAKTEDTTTKQERNNDIKHQWEMFERAKNDCTRRLSTRLSFVGSVVVANKGPQFDEPQQKEASQNKTHQEPMKTHQKKDDPESLKALLNLDIEAEIAKEDLLDEYKSVMSQIDTFSRHSGGDTLMNEDTSSSKQDTSRMMKRSAVVWCEDALRSAFDAVDDDKSGTLSIDEVANLMAALSPKSRKPVTERQREAAELIERYDENNDNMLDFEEFSKLMRVYSSTRSI